MFDQLDNYHPNIKLILEVNTSRFLGTKLANINGALKFNFYQKNTKQPSQWTSKTRKRYKGITINGDLYRSKKNIKEIPLIKKNYEVLITHYIY